MTQRPTNRFERNSLSDVRDEDQSATVGEVLDQVRDHTQRLLRDAPRLPKRLQVRAGEVAVDVEWNGASGPPPEAQAPESAVATPVDEPETVAETLNAPTVGVFYRAPEPGAEPFVSEGDTVHTGQQIGIVEAMKLMIPVEADRDVRIVTVLKKDSEPVEYGEPLFAVEPIKPEQEV